MKTQIQKIITLSLVGSLVSFAAGGCSKNPSGNVDTTVQSKKDDDIINFAQVSGLEGEGSVLRIDGTKNEVGCSTLAGSGLRLVLNKSGQRIEITIRSSLYTVGSHQLRSGEFDLIAESPAALFETVTVGSFGSPVTSVCSLTSETEYQYRGDKSFEVMSGKLECVGMYDFEHSVQREATIDFSCIRSAY